MMSNNNNNKYNYQPLEDSENTIIVDNFDSEVPNSYYY